ncbi:MAG: hypothetical protein IJ773_00525 [Lachnospiraceae bacterium]|nr:hypothetical protein [Lachnospiraceae bacterium]
MTKDGPIWLRYLEERTPSWFRKLEICLLARLTAKAFQKVSFRFNDIPDMPSLLGTTAAEALALYRDYTAASLKNHPKEEQTVLRESLHTRAFRLGRMLSRLPGLQKEGAKKRLVFLLYRNIAITLEGDLPGNLTVPACSFASAYTPEVCFVMSGLDAGVIEGIFGGGTLSFSKRLTEGAPACHAVLQTGE